MRLAAPDFVKARHIRLSGLFIAAFILLGALSQTFLRSSSAEARHRSDHPGSARSRLSEVYGRLPLRFEANRGQTSHKVKFLARGNGYTLFLTEKGAVLRLRKAEAPLSDEARTSSARDATPPVSTLRFRLGGSNRAPKVLGLEELPGKSNYLIGGDPRRWRTDLPSFTRVRYESIYPGVDLIYYGREGQLEYDFIVAPGANPERIRLVFDGARSTRIEDNGDLVIATDGGDVRQQKPLAYQEINGTRREVAARYVKEARGAVRIKLGDYDRTRTLVIDPVILYSSYLGGFDSDQGLAVAVDSAGNAYVTGSTASTDFPGPSPLQGSKSGFSDVFVLKLSPDGKSLAYATYLGGGGGDTGNAIAVDAAGNAYVAGSTGSTDFPVTEGTFQNIKEGGFDAFMAKLNPTGSGLTYSTYLGGNGDERIFSVAADSAGAVYLAGSTDSTNFTRIPGLTRRGNPALKSTDGGANWAVSSAGLSPSAINDFAITPGNPNTVYASTNHGVYKSADGGTSWHLTGQSHVMTAPITTNAVVVDPANPDVVYVGTTGGSGIYKSINGGARYDPQSSGINLPFINTLIIDPLTPSTLYAGTLFGIFKTTTGGNIWTEVSMGLPGSPPNVSKLVIDPANPRIIYAATVNYGVLKSTDGGVNWALINNGLSANGFTPQIRALALDPSNPSTLYLAVTGSVGGIYKSTDGGARWTNITDNRLVVNTLMVDPASSSNIYAGTNGDGVFRSTDGGASWAASNVGLTNKVILALAAHAGSPATIFAGANVGSDAFAAKLNPAGSQLEYWRLFGGAENDEARGVAISTDGNAYITGTTSSGEFPTVNAFQSALSGASDAFAMKLDPSGAPIYATYLGGSATEQGASIAVGAGGHTYVTGTTSSNNFPVANALQPARGDASLTDAFVTKLATDGRSLAYSTYLGGNRLDQGLGIAINTDGSAYVTGMTTSTNFPSVSAVSRPGGLSDAFVTRINPDGSALLSSTYLGGSQNDRGNSVAVDGAGGVYVVGNTASFDFPVVNTARGTFGGGSLDAFITKIGPSVDLAVVMTDSPDPVSFGSDLTYTVNVKNNGDLQATGVTLTDVLPSGASLVSATTNHGECSGASTVVCNLGAFAGGEAASVTITIKPPTVRTITNSATVALNETDAVPSNNSASVETTVNFADLSVSKSVLLGTATPGAKVIYFLTVKHNGGAPIGPITLTDNLPPELTFVSCDSPRGTCGGTDNNRTVTFPSLAAGASEGAVIVTTLNSSVPTGTTVNNTASVGAAFTDPHPSNNTSSASFTVGPTTIAPKSNGKIAIVFNGIFVMNADGTGATLIHGMDGVAERFPVWSPDGTKIAFHSEATGSSTIFEIYVMNSDGTQLRRVSVNGARDSRPTWSPDGSQVAFIGRGSGVYTVRPDGTGEVRIIPSLGIANGLDWSPNGASFTFSKDSRHIFVMDVDGGNHRQLTFTEQTSDGDTRDTAPLWSPDGSQIVFTRRTNNRNDVLVINSDGTNLARLLNIQQIERGSFSPDKTKIIYNSFREQQVVNADGSGLPVTLGFGRDPHWQPLSHANPTPTPTPAQTFTISGRITNTDGSARSAIVKLSGARTASISTDESGHYTFVNLPSGGTYTVTPTTNFNPFTTFAPGSRSIRDLPGHVTGVDFVATAVQPTLKGRIINSQGEPLAGVQVSFFNFGQRTTTTDSDGRYSFTLFIGGNGHSVTPFLSSFHFDPINVLLPTVSGDVTVNFVGAPLSDVRSIQGRVADHEGRGLARLPIALGGARHAVVKTDTGGVYRFENLEKGQTYTLTPSTAEGFRFTTPQRTIDDSNVDPFFNFNATTTQPTAQFAATDVSVAENASAVELTVTRTGDTSAAASVDYETSELTASERSDFIATFGTVRFAKGEASKTFKLLITDDNLVEGERLFTVSMRGAAGVHLGRGSDVTVRITENDTAASDVNPVDASQFFVTQHYADFLNREPDASGLEFWTNEIEQCGTDVQCREVKRINVSAAFFLSIEFQRTGYFVYRLHQAAYGTGQALSLKTFLKDTQEIGRGIVVGQGDWQAQLEANEQAFLNDFVLRPEFGIVYPTTLPPAHFVDALNTNTGGSLSPAERDALVAALTAGTTTRAGVLRAVAGNTEFSRREFNRAFVLMQYFGYLRRSPAAPPDSDVSGWQFWLNKLEQFNGNFIEAEMVKAFISSLEYRDRFGK